MAEYKMHSFVTNDNVTLKYIDTGAEDAKEREKPWLIFLHGFTGSYAVFQRNIPSFTPHYRVIVPDLRGHGASDKPVHGFQVSRLAMDLYELLNRLTPTSKATNGKEWKAIGGSLGCAILWCYASLFTTSPFTHTIFVDQSPLQNLLISPTNPSSTDPSINWGPAHANRGMNSSSAAAGLRQTLATDPEAAHLGTIGACLSYRAFPEKERDEPREGDGIWVEDERFFLGEAMKCDPTYLGNLMSDHTALDWRASIAATFGPSSSSQTKVFVITSTRSGCFPAAGPLCVVDLVNGKDERKGRAQGIAVQWGGHWSYWEDPARFNKLCLTWLETGEVVDE